MNSLKIKRGLYFAGGVLALVGITFVLVRLRSYQTEIDISMFNWTTWTVVSMMVLGYGLSNLMLAFAWRNLLEHFGALVTAHCAVWVYGVSQIAKYVPGNIFHLVGRQALGAAAGLPHWPLAKSAIWELGLIAAMGAIFGLLLLPIFTGYVSFTAAPVFFIGAVILAVLILGRVFSQAIAAASLWYAGFFLLSGILFVGLVELHTEPGAIDITDWLLLIGAYVVAWLAGFVTPGAPAGIGVRELVLLFLLQSLVGEAELVLAVVMSRVVTALGDGLFFAGTSMYGRRFFSAAAIK